MVFTDDNLCNQCGDAEDIEVLYSRIGKAWEAEKDERTLANQFDTNTLIVRKAIKHHLSLYPHLR